MARDGAADEDQTPISIDAPHEDVLSGDGFLTEVASHLLALEHLARVLTLASRTVRTVGHRDAVRGAKTAEVPALDSAGEALTDRYALDVHALTDNKVVCGDFSANFDQLVLGDTEFRHDALGLDRRLGEVTARGLGSVLRLLGAGAELQGDIAVPLDGPMIDHLTAFELKDGDGHVIAGFIEEAGHAEFLGEDACTHRSAPQSLISTSTPADRSSFIRATPGSGPSFS